MNTITSTNRLCQHYKSLGLSSTESARFSNLVGSWIDKSGPEWTVKHLKDVDAAFKKHLASGKYTTIAGWKTRLNRHGTKIYSDGLVHRLMIRSRVDEKSLKRAQNFFRSHQVIKLQDVSEKQYKKFYDGVTKPAPTEANYKTTLSHLQHVIEDGKLRLPKLTKILEEDFLASRFGRFMPLSLWPMNNKSSPVIDIDFGNKFLGFKSIKRTDIQTKDFVTLMMSDVDFNRIWNEYPEKVSFCFTGKTNLPVATCEPLIDLPIGTIGFIQEGGTKLRTVGNPMLAVQALGEPSKRKLEYLCKKIPHIHTFDQTKGQYEIAGWLSEGKKVWSFDATAFTDRFPFEVQKSVMRLLERKGWLNSFDIDVIETLNSKKWFIPLNGEMVRWEVGQVLGTGPSFHLATVSHHMLVQAIAKAFKIKDKRCWVIVGDDIAISDPLLAQCYKTTMTELGVEINLSKSLISQSYAEFCGKLISRNGPIPSIKVREIESVSQLVHYLGFYGSKGLYHLQPHEQRWALKILLPLDNGGLFKQPDGIKYKEFINDLLNTKALQKHALRNEVKNFLNPVARSDVEYGLNSIASYYDHNDLNLSQQDWNRLLHEDVVISEWTGLPEVPLPSSMMMKSTDHGFLSQRTRRDLNRFRDIIDSITRLEFNQAGSNNSLATLDIYKRYLDKQGYIPKQEAHPQKSVFNIKEVSNDREDQGIKSREQAYQGERENKQRAASKEVKQVERFLKCKPKGPR